MQMRRDEMVDALKAGKLCRNVMDSLRIAPARVAGVDQHRLLGWGNNESGSAPFRIDPIDIQRRLRGGSAIGNKDRQKTGLQGDKNELHSEEAQGRIAGVGNQYLSRAPALRKGGLPELPWVRNRDLERGEFVKQIIDKRLPGNSEAAKVRSALGSTSDG